MADAETQAINKDNVIAGAAENAYHPSYSSTDANLVITSSDGVRFRVHSLLLGMGSEIFRDMMSQANDTGEPIVLQEKASVVKMLLDFIYPSAPFVQSMGHNFQDFWNLLIAADKYGFRKIAQEFHERALGGSYFSDKAIEAFVIGARYDWTNVLSNSASEGIDLYGTLSRLDSTRLLKLQKLAELRKRAIREAIDEQLDQMYADEIQYISLATEPEDIEDCEYPAIERTIMEEMERNLERRPSGLSVRDIWECRNVKKYIDENKKRLFNLAIERALNRTAKSAEDISLGCSSKSGAYFIKGFRDRF